MASVRYSTDNFTLSSSPSRTSSPKRTSNQSENRTRVVSTQPSRSLAPTPMSPTIPTDSELIFPDNSNSNSNAPRGSVGSNASTVTNPILPSSVGQGRLLSEQDVASFRVRRIVLKSEDVLLSELHEFKIESCYVDYPFLGEVCETDAVRYSKVMEVGRKHDFRVDRNENKEARSKLIKFFAPVFYQRNADTEGGCMLDFNLVGETDKEVIELAKASVSLLEVLHRGDHTEGNLPLLDKNDEVIGHLVLTTRCQAALSSVAREIEDMKARSQRRKENR